MPSLFGGVVLAALILGVRPSALMYAQSTSAPLPHADADLRALADTLRARHPKLRFSDVRARFDRLEGQLKAGIDTVPRAGAIMRMARLVASLEDGHTQLGLWWDSAIGFQRYPIRVYLFEDGVYVIRTAPGGKQLLGKQLIRIGRLPIDTVIARLRPYLHGDNEMTRRDIVSSRLVLHEVLETIGAASNRHALFVVRDPGGQVDSLWLTPSADQTPPADSIPDDGTAAPLYRQRTTTYWFAPAGDGRTTYAQINAVQSDPGYSFGQFCDSLFRAIGRSGTARLVLDLRLNNGGDNTLDDTLVHHLIRATAIDRPGHFYLIIGRKTFSAAVNLTAELRRHTAAILVGEPTGAPANHYGETASFILPHSGIRLLYSTQYWQSGDPRDHADAIVPDLAVPLRFEDFRANRDPVLAAILARPIPPDH